MNRTGAWTRGEGGVGERGALGVGRGDVCFALRPAWREQKLITPPGTSRPCLSVSLSLPWGRCPLQQQLHPCWLCYLRKLASRVWASSSVEGAEGGTCHPGLVAGRTTGRRMVKGDGRLHRRGCCCYLSFLGLCRAGLGSRGAQMQTLRDPWPWVPTPWLSAPCPLDTGTERLRGPQGSQGPCLGLQVLNTQRWLSPLL